MTSGSFEDRVAIISGSSQGIGKALAIEFTKLGAHVVINGRNADRLAKTEAELNGLGGKVLAVVADLTDEDQAQLLVEKCVEKFGRIDYLINNAGISMRGNFYELRPSVIKSVFSTNVFGVTNLTIPALPYIKEKKGSVVFVSSVAAIRGLPGLSAYCSSKMALRALAESLRIEEYESGIHVGLVQVGFTEIDFEKQTLGPTGELLMVKDRSKFKVQTKERVAEAIIGNIRKRKFITTLTAVGKLNYWMQSLMPGVVEKILIRSSGLIKKRS